MKYKKQDFFPGFWRALVINTEDPKKKGRVMIEFLQFEDKENPIKLWAYPANNAIGGRSNDATNPSGSCMIPPVGSYVYIFFEAGHLDRPRYIAGLDIDFGDAIPENELGDEFWNKWTLFRAPDGNCIIVSNDPGDERTEITGKKRLTLDLKNKSEQVYTIKTNQSSILIDDREGKEKILIKDYKGNYINIDTENDEIEIEANKKMKLKTGGNISINVTGDANIKTSGHTKLQAEGNVAVDANNIFLNCGLSASPEDPDGKRDDTYE